MSEMQPIFHTPKKPAPAAEPTADPCRKCPNCGTAESRWTVDGREHVNLSPITGQCVRCLAEMSKEVGPLQTPELPFDARAAQARNDE